MQAWIDETGQIMAIYTGEYRGQAWQDRGFTPVEVPKEFGFLTRDHRVKVADGVVTAVEASRNPEQPEAPLMSDEALIDDAIRKQAASTFKDDTSLPDETRDAARRILGLPVGK